MQKKTAEQTVSYMIQLLTDYLTELSDVHDTPNEQFAYGEKTAYTECLEILSSWEHAKQHGLTENVETRFPL